MRAEKKKSILKEWLQALLVAVVSVLIIRSFFFEAFTIPTPSMDKTLLPGDFILVNKMSYGARTPLTLLSFPFAHQTLPFSNTLPSYLTWLQLPYWRMPGFGKVERNDIVVFNYPVEHEHPVDQRTHFIKRCVAIPGDVLELKAGVVYVNDSIVENNENIQYNYHIKAKGKIISDSLLLKNEITEWGKISKNGDYSFTLTQKKADSLNKNEEIKSIEKFCEKQGSYAEYIFPNDEKIKWNVDWFGPITIPKQNDTINIGITVLPI